MGKKAPSAPAAPDPAATAAAQTASNKETAYWNAVLNNVNQITPYGTLTYQQTGGGKQYNMDAYNKALAAAGGTAAQTISKTINPYKFKNAYDGTLKNNETGEIISEAEWLKAIANPNAPISITKAGTPANAVNLQDYYTGEAPPSFTSTINLSPEQKAILDRTTANEKALVDLGGQQLGRISQSVNTPFSYAGIPSYGEADQTAAATKAEEALLARLNPQFARDEESLRSRLINQGIGQGSQAYQREMESFNQAKNDARTQSILAGQQYGNAELASALQRRNQGIQEYTTQRNAPLNEYIGLTSGVQVQNPQFSSQGYQGAQGVDYAGLVNNQYQAQVNQSNAKTAARNANIGAATSLLGAAGGFAGGSGSLFGYKLW